MTSPLTLEHRQQQLALRVVTVRGVTRLWPALDVARLDATFPAWATAVHGLVTRNRAVSSALAARYLRRFRVAAGVTGEMPVVLATAIADAELAASLRVTSVVSIKKATARGLDLPTALEHAFVASTGSITRHVLDAGRDTVRASLATDPDARGWVRVVGGKGCDFCQMLAGRGAVYSARTADFASHDHCACSVEPAY